MNFEFATATRIIFGPGKLSQVGKLASEMGHKALVVTGLQEEQTEPLLARLEEAKLPMVVLLVEKEPTTELVNRGVDLGRDLQCDFVIGFGGGSAIDTGKAIAAMLTNPGELLDYLEVIGKGLALQKPCAPLIAIPTTAGTGAEVTRNAVLGVSEQRVKVSLRSPFMLPRLALLDPELTYTLPPAITASTGLDALTQVIEPYVSNQPNPLSDAVCREGMYRVAKSLQRAFEHGEDAVARENMCIASLCGGLALANAKLGAVHGFASPLGGMYPAPHGAVCARLLPLVMEFNLRALIKRAPESEALHRYTEIARILTGNPGAVAQEGVEWVKELCIDLQVPPLSTYGVNKNDLPDLVEKSSKASSMQGNPIRLTHEELLEILLQAL